ncbi:MAG TPA: glycerol-3-phosphate dehydrogenase/oxidase [Gaiellaceae bacterium]
MTEDGRLNPGARDAALRALGSADLDVLVIGGGITGAGVALDAATRGLSVALVEREDFASGTSSRSTKLIHGGLRYLEHRDFRLVREALAERHLLLTKLAPHLVHPIPFLLPVRDAAQRAYFGAGVALYDLLSGGRCGLPRHRHLGRRAARAAAPALRAEAAAGAIRYFDAQIDDARYALTVLRTAVAHGAVAASRVEVVGFRGAERIDGVRLRDRLSGDEFDGRARVTVLAAGVWSRELELLAGVREPISIRASKGVHLLVPRERIELHDALILRTERSVLLVVPWNGHWLIGTTDTPAESATARPTATAEDIDYLLRHVNTVLRRPLGYDDVTGVFAGLRPLVNGGSAETTSISREHVVRRAQPGLVTVAGGKYTTYRVMAADAVDAAAAELGGGIAPSRTAPRPLLGSSGLTDARLALGALDVTDATRERLLQRYGSLATEVTAAGGNVFIEGGSGYLSAEAAYAVTHEGALTVEDVLARRTRIALEADDGGVAAAPHVAAILRRELGWSSERESSEVAAYRRWIAAERAAQVAS